MRRDSANETRDIHRGRVLLVANYRPEAGFAWWLMENFWVQFAELARARGLEPLLAYPEEGQVPESILSAELPLSIMPFPGRTWAGLRRATRLIRSEGVKCVYFTDRKFFSPAYALLRAAGVRLIINHDHTPGDRPPIRGLRGWVKARLRRMRAFTCDLQICVSPLIRQRALENALIPAERVVVVQNGTDPVECREDRGYAIREFGLPRDAKICISVGRADRYKRIDFMIDVARRCRSMRGLDRVHFLFCGDGPDMPRLQGLVKAAGLENRFVFAGYRRDIPKLLCSADMAIHPSRGEAFSLAVVEYMSAGLPVVVADIPSVSQAIQHGITGLLYRDGSVEQAAERIEFLAKDQAARARLGAAAAAHAREHYSRQSMNARFREVLTEILDSIPLGMSQRLPPELAR